MSQPIKANIRMKRSTADSDLTWLQIRSSRIRLKVQAISLRRLSTRSGAQSSVTSPHAM